MKVLFVLTGLFGFIQAHSWIACADYMEKNGGTWDWRKCRGFPRDAAYYARKTSFGRDRRYNYEPKENSPGCRTRLSRSSYSKSYPKAIYYPGQQVVLVHPMKTHGADYCTNRYIPDHGSKIYRGRKNRDANQNLRFFKRRLVADLGVSPFGYHAKKLVRKYPKTGYQNAPLFCQSKDRSMGTYSFNVPKNIAPGRYTFMWWWMFNYQQVYTTCFDVVVVPNKKIRDRRIKARGFGLYVACGGRTSDNSIGSTVGCNSTNSSSISESPQ